jgi:uncharacterized Zn finger protein
MSIMDITNEQLGKIITAYFDFRASACPDCGSDLDVNGSNFAVRTYPLPIRCLECGRLRVVVRDMDPLRDSFREWTTEEKEALKASPRGSRCPVDGSQIDVIDRTMTSGGGFTMLRCPRCNQVTQ